MRRRAAPAVGFDVSTSSASLCPQAVSKHRGTLHPVAVLSISLSSPPPHLLHLLIFSTSSSSPPPHLLLHSGVVFSMSIVTIGFSALSSNRRRRVALRMAGIPGLKYSMATAQRMGREGGCSPAALDAIAVFSLWVTIPALHFPRRHLLRGTLCRRYISSLLFTVVLVVGCPLCRDRVALVIAGVVG